MSLLLALLTPPPAGDVAVVANLAVGVYPSSITAPTRTLTANLSAAMSGTATIATARPVATLVPAGVSPLAAFVRDAASLSNAPLGLSPTGTPSRATTTTTAMPVGVSPSTVVVPTRTTEATAPAGVSPSGTISISADVAAVANLASAVSPSALVVPTRTTEATAPAGVSPSTTVVPTRTTITAAHLGLSPSTVAVRTSSVSMVLGVAAGVAATVDLLVNAVSRLRAGLGSTAVMDGPPVVDGVDSRYTIISAAVSNIRALAPTVQDADPATDPNAPAAPTLTASGGSVIRARPPVIIGGT